MRMLAPALLPLAATALAVTTLSTAAAPARPADEPKPLRQALAPHVGTTSADRPRTGTPTPPVGRLARPVAVPVPGAGARWAPVPRGRWAWPLQPRPPVARTFVRPTSTWGAGHRGVDLGATVGRTVLAVDDGLVAHVGVVAGRGTITVLHRSGLRSTYEPVTPSVRARAVVRQGQPIGTLTAGGHCAPAACLHLGALRGEAYLDPLTLLGGARVRLLPLR